MRRRSFRRSKRRGYRGYSRSRPRRMRRRRTGSRRYILVGDRY